MALLIGLFISLLFGYIAALPAIIFKKKTKTNLNGIQKFGFLLLAYFLYNILFYLVFPQTTKLFHAPITGYIMFWFILSDNQNKTN